MSHIWNYIKDKWKRYWAIKPEDKYPAQSPLQTKYRQEFGGIVDKYLITYSSNRNKENPKGYHRIVYIDADNEINSISDGDNLTAEEKLKRNEAMSRLRNVQSSCPVKNLPEDEILHFKRLLGSGYNAALAGNWNNVEQAILDAKRYRDDRSKEHSRWLLLMAATLYLAFCSILYILYYFYIPNHTHFNLLTGMMMGALGAYVSIWTRYGKMDMTGLGMPKLHYLEAFSRMLIGIILSLIAIMALRSKIIFGNLSEEQITIYIYCIVGFCAGFSEKWVPSVLERFMEETNKQQPGKEYAPMGQPTSSNHPSGTAEAFNNPTSGQQDQPFKEQKTKPKDKEPSPKNKANHNSTANDIGNTTSDMVSKQGQTGTSIVVSKVIGQRGDNTK